MSSSDTIPPPQGTPHPDAAPAPHTDPAPAPAPGKAGSGPSGAENTTEASSSSGDELSLLLNQSLKQPDPDPFLGEFRGSKPAPGSAPPSAPRPKSRPKPAPAPAPPPVVEPEGDSFDAVSAINALFEANPVEPVASPPPKEARPARAPSRPERRSGSGSTSGTAPALDALRGLDLGGPRPSSSRAASEGRKAGAAGVADDEDEDEDDQPPSGTSWLTLLLLSYSSAVTVGLLWVLFSGRQLREHERVEGELGPAPAPVVDSRADTGRRADQSRKFVPPPPIPTDHLTTLGTPVQLGSLEATPMEVTTGVVMLKRTLMEEELREGEAGVLKLKLRLKNTSSDLVFAPLDEAFLRRRDRAPADSLIETTGSGQIGMYPLALTSEWTIVGQDFQEIGPGAWFDTLVCSAPDAIARVSPEMTWRVRLRTGMNQTEVIGVRIRQDEVKPDEVTPPAEEVAPPAEAKSETEEAKPAQP